MNKNAQREKRTGPPPARGIPKWIWALAVCALIIGTVFYFTRPVDEKPTRHFDGCNSNKECTNGRICAAGGCIILLSDEIEEMWERDLDQQFNANTTSAPWNPHPAFGTKLLNANNCTGKSQGELRFDAQGVVTIFKKVNIFVATTNDFQLFQQIEAKSTMWMKSLPFQLPKAFSQPPNVFCHSSEINAFKVTPSPTLTQLTAALTHSAPAGSVVSAAMLAKRPLPKPAKDGSATIEFDLSPIITGVTEEKTVLTLPLGTDMISLKGSQPSRQRLLHGHVAYYWTHDNRPHAITAIIKLPQSDSLPLNFHEIKP